MNNTKKNYHSGFAAIAAVTMLALAGNAAQAAKIEVLPANSTFDTAVAACSIGIDCVTSLEIYMDFTDELTIGGGFNIDVFGAAALGAFTPSSWLVSLNTDASGVSDFTGWGANIADAGSDYGIIFGSFSGLSGRNKVGDLRVNLTALGAATIALSASQTWGEFIDGDGFIMDPQPSLDGASISVQAVPLPATALMFIPGLIAFLFGARRMRS